jgi:hypothetical protein
VVRGALSGVPAVALALLAFGHVAWASVHAPQPAAIGIAAVGDAVLRGRALPPPDQTADLPASAQPALAEYRRREAVFKSALTPPRGATPDETRLFEQRVGIERVVFSLFDRRESARVAAAYALDADLGFQEIDFIDGLLRNRQQPWLAPYLNLVAGALKLCGGDEPGGRRQLAAARDAGQPLIRLVAEDLLREKRCPSD